MKKIILAAVVTLAVLFGGCASVGKKIDHSRVSELEKGVSTRSDVERVFGAPMEVEMTGENKVLMKYVYTRATAKGINFVPVVGMFAGGMNTRTQQLSFLIDEAGVVENWVWNDSPGEVRSGIISN